MKVKDKGAWNKHGYEDLHNENQELPKIFNEKKKDLHKSNKLLPS